MQVSPIEDKSTSKCLPGSAASPALRVELSPLDEYGSASAPSADSETALALAEQIAGYHYRLEEAYSALRQREAELATAVPLSVLDDEGIHLADRLEWVMQAGAKALGCEAAALYLLDDATQTLKLRSSWGLPRHRLVEPPRTLRGAVADLEALIGSAVVLEEVRLAPFWRAPEGFPAALCLPVSTSQTPLGTLWFFSKEARDFSPTQVELAEVTSGRIVADLERETLRHEVRKNRDYGRQVREGLLWQQERLPDHAPPLDDWSFAGHRNPTGWVGGSFFDWLVLPDSRILMVAAYMEGTGVASALGSAFLRGTIWSHSQVSRDPGDLLQRTHETLWTSSPGGQRAAMFAAMIEPDLGKWQYATAGPWHLQFGRKKPTVQLLENDWLGDQLDSAWTRETGETWKKETRLCVASAASISEELWQVSRLAMADSNDSKPSAGASIDALKSALGQDRSGSDFDHVALVAHRHHDH